MDPSAGRADREPDDEPVEKAAVATEVIEEQLPPVEELPAEEPPAEEPPAEEPVAAAEEPVTEAEPAPEPEAAPAEKPKRRTLRRKKDDS